MEHRYGANFPQFKAIWDAIDVEFALDASKLGEGHVEVSGFLFPEDRTPLVFKERIEPIFHFPQFAILRFYPAPNPETMQLLEQANAEGPVGRLLRLWDICDVTPLLEQIEDENTYKEFEEILGTFPKKRK
jgi:hypothetical protein